MRRIFTVLLLLAIAGAAGWTLWQWERVPGTSADPWRAMPEQSAAVLVIPEPWLLWDRFTHTSRLWQTFEQWPEAAAIGQVLGKVNTSLERELELRDALAASPMLVALLREGGSRVGHVVCMAIPEHADALSPLAEPLGLDAAMLASLAAGQAVIMRPHAGLGAQHARWTQGLLLMASSGQLLDDAMHQFDRGERLDDDPGMQAAKRTLGAGADAHLILHTERTLRLLHHWWRPEALATLDLPQGWVAMDVGSRPDALLFSGLFSPEAGHRPTEAFLAQGQGRTIGERTLPAGVSVMSVQHLTDAMRWPKDRFPTGAADDPDEALAQALLSWVEGGMAIATQAADEVLTTRRWAVMRTSDPYAAELGLQRLCGEGCDSLVYRGHRMARMGRAAVHERVLGPAFAFLERPWWTILGDEVLFSDDVAALRSAIDVWNDGGTLAEDARHAAWSQRISDVAGYTLRCDVARARSVIRAGLKDDAAMAFDQHDSLWSGLGNLSLQLSPGRGGSIHITAGLQHAPLASRGTSTLWATALGTPVSRKPDIVRNHVNNSREVLVQDDMHKLHLLGSNGMVLWSRQLDGPIMGAVHQVDRYRNGKLQLLFNTAGHIHLVDRNGKDVTGMPVRLATPATAPLAVFDYDNEREYRVLVPVADGRILNHGLEGVPVKGWSPKALRSASENSVRHIRIRNKDHLLIVDGGGSVHVLDRRGDPRASQNVELAAGANVVAVIPGTELETSALIWNDADGALHETTLGGQTRRLSPSGPGRDHWMNVDGDGVASVLRMAGDTLSRHRAGSAVFTRAKGAMRGEAHSHALGRGQHAISVVLSDAGQVVLLDPSGATLEGTPVPGVVPFSIADLDLDGEFEAVTITSDGTVTAHRIRGLSRTGP